MKNIKNTKWEYIVIGALVISLGCTVVWGFNEKNQVNNTTGSHETVDVATAFEEQGIIPLSSDQASNNTQTADSLAYILEEEKLAHDVYQVMSDKWGSRVFGNIKNSETMHQNMVLAVMQSRSLVDSRNSELGKFTNSALQALYNKLIAQGSLSAAEGFKVGIAIEELDIADLKDMLANLDPKDTDVKGVLESLLQGSESHLRAFNRQVSR